MRLARSGYAGADAPTLCRETGLVALDVAAHLDALVQADRALAAGGTWLGAEAAAALETRLLGALEDFHRREPLLPGMPRATLRGALPDNTFAGAFEALLARLEAVGAVVSEADHVRDPQHVPILSREQEVMAAHIRADAMTGGLEPATPRDWAEALGVAPESLDDLLGHLVRDGSLVRAPGGFYFDRVAVDELRERVVTHLRDNGSLDTPAYKALIGTSRKYAVPLMELFDAEHLTVRTGEVRKLRRR